MTHTARAHSPGRCRYRIAVAALLLAWPTAAGAQTEFHYQYGKFVNPFTGQHAYASVLTVQQASRWSLGDSFYFIDFTDDGGADGFNEKSYYGEWYPTLSLGRVSNRTIGAGPIRDVAIVSGFNFGSDANIFRYVPGGRLSWSVPGFYFLNTDFAAAFDKGNGIDGARGTAYLLLVNGATAGGPVITGRGVYTDELVKTSEGWLFRKRAYHPEDFPTDLRLTAQ